ncbi:dienelactone hydrolase family protein [Aspergillus melleus]|uniref:dienelactone hydrolase family protein n=1 Tax=Aspergillus melleus TaxID=138277 RepID=UPI001E8CBF06|nr:uncharacterized protein LDX57_010954 [Aspergillus melleus]KAH8433318.1 hypothetical protein LDX57_010954 [Aspergillus melleus]
MSSISQACCSIPPVVSKGYEPKGEYTTLNGLKTYVTGPESATEAILLIYDIFGFFPQTIQGADILATSPRRKYRVFMPDFFEGKSADISWYPPTTEEQTQNLTTFFSTQAVPPKTLARIPGIVNEANKTATSGTGYAKWAIVGHCWGGKIASLSAGKDNAIFQAAVQCHPAMVDPADAAEVTVPMALLASGDEPAEDVAAYQANLKVPNHVETFASQIHGWMAARSNLEDGEVRKEYERGYKTVLSFLEEHL